MTRMEIDIRDYIKYVDSFMSDAKRPWLLQQDRDVQNIVTRAQFLQQRLDSGEGS